MSKYKPLTERLSGHAEDEWRTTFADLETVLGFALPKGARGGPAWWTNDGDKPHSRAWTSAGWQVFEVDRANETVTFRRNMASADIEAAGGIEPSQAQPSIDEPEAPRPEEGAGGRAADDYRPQGGGSAKVQPDAMRRAAEGAARASRLRRSAPTLAAGVAVVAGVAALVARTVIRRRSV